MEKILLHCCCGPCAEYPLSQLVKEDYQIILYYYNPNIHPQLEWQRRLEQLELVAAAYQLPLIVEGKSQPDKWLAYGPDDQAGRCSMCYEDRISASAAKAAQLACSGFLTSLQVSPYQDFDQLVALGQQAARQTGLSFMDYDFRPGFRQGQTMARERGLYRQKYCGCMISLAESSFREKIERDLQGLRLQHK